MKQLEEGKGKREGEEREMGDGRKRERTSR